jgi:hypothetical protein
MLIKALAWLFAPQKKTRRTSGGGGDLTGWLLLALVTLAWLG